MWKRVSQVHPITQQTKNQKRSRSYLIQQSTGFNDTLKLYKLFVFIPFRLTLIKFYLSKADHRRCYRLLSLLEMQAGHWAH